MVFHRQRSKRTVITIDGLKQWGDSNLTMRKRHSWDTLSAKAVLKSAYGKTLKEDIMIGTGYCGEMPSTWQASLTLVARYMSK